MALHVTVVFGKPISSFILEPKSICFISFTFSTRSCSWLYSFPELYYLMVTGGYISWEELDFQLTSTVFSDNLIDNMHVTELYTLDVLGFF